GPGTGNLVSAKSGSGIIGFGGVGLPSVNVVQGNKIGTDITGNKALPNFGHGVLISAQNTLVGGTADGAGNLISGNRGDGVKLASTVGPGNVVQGNRIGTNAA